MKTRIIRNVAAVDCTRWAGTNLACQQSGAAMMITEALPKLHRPLVDTSAVARRLKAARHRIRTAWCGLYGHDLLLHFGRAGRICLQCSNCGHETPGWSAR
jgi:hypothetical protein